ncbi:hypothetical protein SDC9_196819 [bioreactor metagenome]|uniref:Uncharacterized protein n=1 Tax=bioreactor metagenome TaxID=1076179 RepID=A0A645ILL1_9ZZZZ
MTSHVPTVCLYNGPEIIGVGGEENTIMETGRHTERTTVENSSLNSIVGGCGQPPLRFAVGIRIGRKIYQVNQK